jgi:hypothetical protein
MAQQSIEFEVVTEGLWLRILAAVVDGRNVLDQYIETEVSMASSEQSIYAAIDKLAEGGPGSKHLTDRFNRLKGLIYELRPPCSHVVLCWFDGAAKDVVIVHVVPRAPGKPVGRDAINLAERRAKTFLQKHDETQSHEV